MNRSGTRAEDAPPEVEEGRPDVDAMTTAVADFLRAAGLPEVASGEAPAKTATAWVEHLLSGYGTDPMEVLSATWPDRTGDLVVLRRIPFVSVCAHHLLPFFGEAHLGYVPDGRLTGFSRLESLVECLARRLQVQERLTEEIVDNLSAALGSKGAICVVEAEHLCVTGRGKRRSDTRAQTVATRGAFADDPALQDRFMNLLTTASGAG